MIFQFSAQNTFCINLDRRQDRWHRMQRIFNVLDIPVTRWKANTPSEVTDVIEGTPTQQACSQSHISLWRHIQEQKIEYALIFEDDVCIDFKWREKLQAFPAEVFHLILLTTDHWYGEPHTWQHTQSQSWSTAAYIVHRQAIELLLKFPYMPADRMTRTLQTNTQNKHCYSFFPYLAISIAADSDIEGSVSYVQKQVTQLETVAYALSNYCGISP